MHPAHIALVLLAAISFTTWADDDLELNVRNYILNSIKDGKKQTVIPGPLGKVFVVSGNEEGIEVEQLSGGRMPMKWKQLKPKELYSLARNMLKEGDVDGHLIVARYAPKADAIEEMDRTLEKLEIAKPNAYGRIERVRTEIAEAKPKSAAPAVTPVATAPVEAENADKDEKEKPKASGALAAAGLAPSTSAQGGSPGVNHAGRPLPPLPKFDKPILYHTPEADAIVSAMQIFPTTNPWNEDISKKPVHPDSDAIVASIGA
ncbi:MAG TPA: hypothetical protein VEJ63_24575, partial [Planctomycetota bacterium]|nr:hypothetical protein [Planctomycetota bacterium]